MLDWDIRSYFLGSVAISAMQNFLSRPHLKFLCILDIEDQFQELQLQCIANALNIFK